MDVLQSQQYILHLSNEGRLDTWLGYFCGSISVFVCLFVPFSVCLCLCTIARVDTQIHFVWQSCALGHNRTNQQFCFIMSWFSHYMFTCIVRLFPCYLYMALYIQYIICKWSAITRHATSYKRAFCLVSQRLWLLVLRRHFFWETWPVLWGHPLCDGCFDPQRSIIFNMIFHEARCPYSISDTFHDRIQVLGHDVKPKL